MKKLKVLNLDFLSSVFKVLIALSMVCFIVCFEEALRTLQEFYFYGWLLSLLGVCLLIEGIIIVKELREPIIK